MKHIYLLIILIIVAVGIWFWTQKQTEPTPQPPTMKDSTKVTPPDTLTGSNIQSLAVLDSMVAAYDLSNTWDQTYCNRMLVSIDDFLNMKRELSPAHASQLKQRVLLKNAALFTSEVNSFIPSANPSNRSRIAELLHDARTINNVIQISTTIDNLNKLEEAFGLVSNFGRLFTGEYNGRLFDEIQNSLSIILAENPIGSNVYLRNEFNRFRERRRRFSNSVQNFSTILDNCSNGTIAECELYIVQFEEYPYYRNQIERIMRNKGN